MPRIMLLGPPGSGKGTQAALLVEHYGIPAIATGDELRHELAIGSKIGKKAKSYMSHGKLVPDEIILEMVKGILKDRDLTNGFLFDGFPRTTTQAEELDAILDGMGMGLQKVFYLKVVKRVLIKRLTNRRICPVCGITYNMSGRKPNVAEYCDACRSELVMREDDKPEVIEKRLNVYNEQTKPLIKYYKDKGILTEIDASTGDPESKFHEIVGLLKAG